MKRNTTWLFRTTWALLAANILVVGLSNPRDRVIRADSKFQGQSKPVASEPLVIQGRITSIEGALVTVKTPDGYPGGPRGNAQYVTAGPAFRVDVSRARVLLPDGRQADKVPLAVGDRVVVLLSEPDSGPPGPGDASKTYFASIVERVIQSEKIVTH